MLAGPATDAAASAAAAGVGGQGVWAMLAAAHSDPSHALLPSLSAPALAGDMLQWTSGGLATVFSATPLPAAADDLGAFDGVTLDALLPSDSLSAPRSSGEALGGWRRAPSPAGAPAAPAAGSVVGMPSLGSSMPRGQALPGPWAAAAMDVGAHSASAPVWSAASGVLGGSPDAAVLAAGGHSMPLAPAAPMWAAGGSGAGGDSSTVRRKLRERTLSMPDLTSRCPAPPQRAPVARQCYVQRIFVLGGLPDTWCGIGFLVSTLHAPSALCQLHEVHVCVMSQQPGSISRYSMPWVVSPGLYGR